MEIGSPHGVKVELQSGIITSLVCERAQRRITLTESFENLHAAPSFDGVDNRLDTKRDSFTQPLNEIVTVSQTLGNAARTIAVSSTAYTGTFNGTSSERRSIEADIHIRFDLENPATWQAQLTEPGISYEFTAGELTMTLAGAGRLVCRASKGKLNIDEPDNIDGSLNWNVSLPAGQSEITLRLTIKPWENVSDTMVLCRPDQLREAAIAIAAIADRRFIPLIVLDPPPMALVEFSSLYLPYKAMVDESLGMYGTFSKSELSSADEEDVHAHNQHLISRRKYQHAMEPYRSWAKRNQMLRKSIRDFPITRAVCLFHPGAEDLIASGVEAAVKDSAEEGTIDYSRTSNLLDDIEQVPLTSCTGQDHPNVGDVFTECQDLFGEANREVIEVDNQLTQILGGLFEARQTHRSLRIREATESAIVSEETTAFEHTQRSDHAIVVEVHDHAQILVAALYAADIGSDLVTTSLPDLTKTDGLVNEMQHAVDEYAAPASRRQTLWQTLAEKAEKWTYGKSQGLKEAFDERFFGDRRGRLLRALESAVAEQIDQKLTEIIGDRRITVFSIGLPYSLAKTRKLDWSEKPIGHVLSDADLVIINEYHTLGAVDPVVAFNLIVDPGFFKDSETEDVAHALTFRAGKSFVLGQGADIAALFGRLVNSLAFDFVFFNTHGSDNSILLGSHPMAGVLRPSDCIQQLLSILDRRREKIRTDR